MITKHTTDQSTQYTVDYQNLRLVQTCFKDGTKVNDCSVLSGDTCEIVSPYDDRFSVLFIALHHHKGE
jgi:hypothetical protein